jgi:hypothetical protein
MNPTFNELKDGIIEDYHRKLPGEKLYGKIFSIYILDRYIKLLIKLYRQAAKRREQA